MATERWRELVDEVIEEAGFVVGWQVLWSKSGEDSDKQEWKRGEARLSAKRKELVEAVEKIRIPPTDAFNTRGTCPDCGTTLEYKWTVSP